MAISRQGKRNTRNTRILQKMWMQEQARTIDSKAGAISLARSDMQNGPDYKTPAYVTDADFHANLASSIVTYRDNRRVSVNLDQVEDVVFYEPAEYRMARRAAEIKHFRKMQG